MNALISRKLLKGQQLNVTVYWLPMPAPVTRENIAELERYTLSELRLHYWCALIGGVAATIAGTASLLRQLGLISRSVESLIEPYYVASLVVVGVTALIMLGRSKIRTRRESRTISD